MRTTVKPKWKCANLANRSRGSSRTPSSRRRKRLSGRGSPNKSRQRKPVSDNGSNMCVSLTHLLCMRDYFTDVKIPCSSSKNATDSTKTSKWPTAPSKLSKQSSTTSKPDTAVEPTDGESTPPTPTPRVGSLPFSLHRLCCCSVRSLFAFLSLLLPLLYPVSYPLYSAFSPARLPPAVGGCLTLVFSGVRLVDWIVDPRSSLSVHISDAFAEELLPTTLIAYDTLFDFRFCKRRSLLRLLPQVFSKFL